MLGLSGTLNDSMEFCFFLIVLPRVSAHFHLFLAESLFHICDKDIPQLETKPGRFLFLVVSVCWLCAVFPGVRMHHMSKK